MARRPAAILGHNLAAAAVTVNIPYAAVLFVVGEAAFIAVGTVIGIGVVLIKIRGERRG